MVVAGFAASLSRGLSTRSMLKVVTNSFFVPRLVQRMRFGFHKSIVLSIHIYELKEFHGNCHEKEIG